MYSASVRSPSRTITSLPGTLRIATRWAIISRSSSGRPSNSGIFFRSASIAAANLNANSTGAPPCPGPRPAARRCLRTHDRVQALRLSAVALAAVGDLVLLRAHEMMRLAEGRPDAAHLEHQPLQRIVLPARAGRQEFAGLAGEVDEDRARFHERERLAVGALWIDDRRDLAVRVDRNVFGRELVALADVDPVNAVRQAAFLKHD